MKVGGIESMIRRIITINEEACNGCGLCASACHEGAIIIENGKAKLLREDYCDGLGDCLPACPMDAISFEEREAAAYDEEAVKAHLEQRAKQQGNGTSHVTSGCPGSKAMTLEHKKEEKPVVQTKTSSTVAGEVESELGQWPVQIQLAAVNASYFQGAKLLVAADCTAYAYGDFHRKFIKDHVTLIGCPKLDPVDYSEKLTEILRQNDIKSVHVVRMTVPCCGGIENAVKKALQASGKMIPWQLTIISPQGEIVESF